VISTASFSGNDVVNLGIGNDSADTGVATTKRTAARQRRYQCRHRQRYRRWRRRHGSHLGEHVGAVSSIVWILPSTLFRSDRQLHQFRIFRIVSTGSGNDAIVTGTAISTKRSILGDGNDTITVSRGSDSVNGEGGADDQLIVDYGGSTSAVNSGSNSYGNGTDRNVSFADSNVSSSPPQWRRRDQHRRLQRQRRPQSRARPTTLPRPAPATTAWAGGAGADALDGGTGADQ
jgi:hypothetical protein